MDTFAELQSAVLSDMNINSSSTLFPTATVKLALNRARIKAYGLFRWPELTDALKTSSVSGDNYFDYPDGWQRDSAWKLVIDSEDYGDPLLFKDYLYETENDIPSGADYLWSSSQGKIFYYPTSTTNGNNNISIWGQKSGDSLSADADVTIFSYDQIECNEAIVLEAVAILKSKGGVEEKGQFRSAEAKTILTVAYGKIRGNRMKYEKIQPQFDIPDYYGRPARRSIDDIGRF